MNKELKKYIKSNLKEKHHHFHFKLKSLFFDENEDFTPKILPELRDDIDSNQINHLEEELEDDLFDLIDSLYDTDEKKTIDINNDVIPFLKRKGIDIDKDYDLPSFLMDNKDYSNFQSTLFKMIDERNLKDSDVYNKVHLDRRLFSKIRNDKSYHPSKETVILIGLSLELNEDEIEILLDSASYSLPRNNEYDLIIRFCFMKGIYEISKVNELLSEYNYNEFNY